MSLAELRKQLKELRKSAMPTPVSRMKKTDVAREIERLAGLHKKEEKEEHKEHVEEVKEVKKVMKKEAVAKPVAEKVTKTQEKHHKEEEKKTKKEHKEQQEVVAKPKKVAAEEPMRPTKYIKGSQEAKDHMAQIRAKRGKKDE